jgi:sugar transferase (PEP-CTERM/EpsH1 system associated)
LIKSEGYDLVVAFSSQVAHYIPKDLSIPFVMDMVDVDSAKFDQYADQAGWFRSKVLRLEARRLRAFEKDIGKRAARVVLTTDREVALYEELVGSGPLIPIVNGVVVPDAVATQSSRNGKLSVFLGQMDYPPNIEAVIFAATQVWPRVRKRIPDAVFRIVGRNPVREVKELARLEGVEVTGTVPDLRAHLEAASLSLVPLRIARGIQNKVLESLAFGVPVVTTQAVLGTLHPDAKEAIRTGESAEELAEHVLALLPDSQAREKLGDAGRQFVKDHHDWAAFDRSWGALLGEVLRGPGSPAGPPLRAHINQ